MRVHHMAGHLIRRLNQISTSAFTQRMQERGVDLTQVQFAAMDAIATFPGIDQAGVAAKIAYDRATIGGVIDRLEQKGYISRLVSKQDRRARVLRLTKMGERLFEEMLPEITDLQNDILTRLNQAERDWFLKLARKAVGPLSEDALS